MTFRTTLNLLLVAAMLLALVLLASRADEGSGVVFEAREPLRSTPIGAR